MRDEAQLYRKLGGVCAKQTTPSASKDERELKIGGVEERGSQKC